MFQNENKTKIMELFFDFPSERFQLREISRKNKIAVTSVKKYIKDLTREGIVIKIEKGVYPSFMANQGEEKFRFYKKLNLIERTYASGLIEYLNNKCLPNAIILFGSASCGEDLEGSDIDLFLYAKETKIDLRKFSQKLNRKINLFFEEKFSKLSSELKNNILNGVILGGYIKIF